VRRSPTLRSSSRILTLVTVLSLGTTACGSLRGESRVHQMEMVQVQAANFRPVAQPAQMAAPAPIGNWTAQRGVEIARRALRWLGTPYAWAGGNEVGPTRGVPVDYDSRNDGRVIGFDCSGLVLYALAPWRRVTHLASAQYTEVGSFHPTLDTMQPGDFVFWSKDGTVGGIGHVAVYLGGGRVVQAPRSGDVVRVTWLNEVESGTMGATRPLT
jgi:peptidoglycan DL-endopeptidase RipA